MNQKRISIVRGKAQLPFTQVFQQILSDSGEDITELFGSLKVTTKKRSLQWLDASDAWRIIFLVRKFRKMLSQRYAK